MTERAALYVRVSTKEQVDGFSLDAQRRACRSLCEARGYQLVAEYADEGISAHTDNLAKRPAFSRMLADADAHQFTILIVHKMDRFARNVIVQMQSIGRLGKAGARLVSASEPDFDYTTPMGFMQMGIMSTLAEYYSRNLSEETKKGWAERKRSGYWAGRLPYGVIKSADGIPIPDTIPYMLEGVPTSNHEGLLFAFTRASQGASDQEVAIALTAAGYRPTGPNARELFGRDALRHILANRFYIGELPVGKRGKDGWVAGKHSPIVPLALFHEVQSLRHERLTRPVYVSNLKRIHALSGLVRCAECEEPMQQTGQPRLMCRRRRLGQSCRSRSVAEWVIEDGIAAYLDDLHLPSDSRERILAAYQAEQPERTLHEQRRRTIEAQLRRLTDVYVMGGALTRPEFEAKRRGLQDELGRYTDQETHGDPGRLTILHEYLLSVGAAWAIANPEERNKLGRTLFESVYVKDQRLAAVLPRPEFQPYFALANANATEALNLGGIQTMTRRARGDSVLDSHSRTIFRRELIAV